MATINMADTIIISMMLQVSYCYTFEDIDRLRKFLFNQTRYNKNIRPTFNQSATVQVNVTQQMISLEEVNTSNGYIETIDILQVTWFDDFLVWNPSEFGGISQLTLPVDHFWKPVLIVTSGATNDDLELANAFSPTIATNNGWIKFLTGGYLKTKCLTDATFFPFDSQVCSVQIMCSNHDIKDVVLQSPYPTIDMSKFTANNEWTVENTFSTSKNFDVNFFSIEFSLIENRVIIKRRPAFVVIHSYIPLMLLVVLCDVTCWVPVDSGERLSFSMTVFLSFLFTSTAIAIDLPRDSLNISMASYSTLAGNLITTLGVLWSVFVVRLSKITTEQYKIPKVILKFICCFRTSNASHNKNCKSLSDKKKSTKIKISNLEDSIDIKESYQEKNVTEIANSVESEHCFIHEVDHVTWLDVSKMLDKLYFIGVIVALFVFNSVIMVIMVNNGVLKN